jgi:hypothetical protein
MNEYQLFFSVSGVFWGRMMRNLSLFILLIFSYLGVFAQNDPFISTLRELSLQTDSSYWVGENSEFYAVSSEVRDKYSHRSENSSLLKRRKASCVSCHPNYSWKIEPSVLMKDIKKGQKLTIQRYSAGEMSIEIITLTSAEQLAQLVRDASVIYIGLESVLPTTDSRVIDMNLWYNSINRIHSERPDLNGTQMTVSIKEGFFDQFDIDIRNRYKRNSDEEGPVDIHATEMATIIAGAGNSFVTGKGVAFESSITTSTFTSLAADDIEHHETFDGWVQNHSYGTEIENFYGAFASSYDLAIWENPELFHVFSAGNQGAATPEDGAYTGIEGVANLTGNFKHSKNTIVVGSIDTLGIPMRFSSQGPAFDGRVKPELVTYSMAGTSNSAALTSGVSLLLQQYYRETYDSLPLSCLLKSVMISSADDVFRTGPDYTTGFGSLDAYNALRVLEGEQFWQRTIAAGDSLTFSLVINQPSDLRLALSWIDLPILAGASKALVADLDILLVTPSGEVLRPWVLSTDPSGLTATATRGVDTVNNTELISEESVSAGNYIVVVKAGNDFPNSVPFAVSYHLQEEGFFEWEYPAGGDFFPFDGETGTYFKWESNYPEGTVADISVSYDQGQTWESLVSNLELAAGQYRWEASESFNAIAVARMQIGNSSFVSEPFTVGPIPEIAGGTYCGDSVVVSWSGTTGADRYRIATIGNQRLETVLVTDATQVVLPRNDLPENFVSIQPLAGDLVFVPAPTFSYNQLFSQCYLASFFAEADRTSVRGTVELSTLAFVESVSLLRQSGKEQAVVQQLENLPSRSFTIADPDPVVGSSSYWVRLQLAGGQQLESNSVDVIYLDQETILVYPNPLDRNSPLQVDAGPGQTLQLSVATYDGRMVLIEELTDANSFIRIDKLETGTYVYRISRGGKILKSGRLVIQ